MATLNFTSNLQRHVEVPAAQVAGATIREILDTYFSANPQVRGYILDDQVLSGTQTRRYFFE